MVGSALCLALEVEPGFVVMQPNFPAMWLEGCMEDLWDRVKRVRTGGRSISGDNSSEYEVIGGIRIDDRRPRSRKKEEEVA